MSDTILALVHGTTQATTGYLVGKGTDVLMDKIPAANKIPLVRVFGQFSIGFLALGEVMRGLGGTGLFSSPISDGLLMVWFYKPQDGLWAAVDQVESAFFNDVSSIFSGSS